MESPVDIELLSQPIEGADPCGMDLREDVRFDSPYQVLKNLRDEAMDMERGDRSAVGESSQDTGQQRNKWREVVDQAELVLKEHSKDIEVCALYIEGLVRTDGLSGVAGGLKLTRVLVGAHWDEMFPRIDPDDADSVEDRVAAFNGLDGAGQPGTLARYLPRLPITESGQEDFQCYQLEQAFNAQATAKEDEDGNSTSRLSFELADLERAAQSTSIGFYQRNLDWLKVCEENLQELDALFTELCGFAAPSTSMIREAFEKLGGNFRYLAGDRLAATLAADEEVPSEETSTSDQPAPSASKQASGPLQSRADAIEQLRKVARFFRETEPHSPVSYSLENVVRWAGMPLDRLIDEWIDDDAARERYRLMTGMRGGMGSDED